MKTLAQISTIVNGMLDSTGLSLDQYIIDSVNYLSNFFNIKSIDTSQSSAVDGATLNKPTDCLEILSVHIDDEEIRPLKDLADLETVRQGELQRWYEFGGSIQFTQAFTAVAAAKIYYKKGFLEPGATTATDVPETLLELVYLGTLYRYYNKLISQVVLSRDDVPDINPDELRLIRDDILKDYENKIKLIKMQNG